jgi:glycosyltransferase involved in cell wall biosynthesis
LHERSTYRMSIPVSVVIPTYNSRDTVGGAIESALDQTAAPAEVVVVDDGSDDGTAAYVEARYGARVHLIVTPNGGPSRARNRGLDAASQPYVAFLDADDVWHADKLACQWPWLRDDPAIGTVASDWVRRAEDLPDHCRPPVPVTRFSYLDTLVMNRFQTSTVLTRTALVREVGGFDPAVDGAEDWDLWVRLARRGGVVKLDRPLVVYRDVATGYSKDLMRVYRTMERLLDKHRETGGIPPAQFREIEAWHHLRFAVAFYLLHDRHAARMAWRRGWSFGRASWVAAARRLTPFVVDRVRRRL